MAAARPGRRRSALPRPLRASGQHTLTGVEQLGRELAAPEATSVLQHSHGADAELAPPLVTRAQHPAGQIGYPGHPESRPLRLPLAQSSSENLRSSLLYCYLTASPPALCQKPQP
ncbi:hypothetical protein QTO34_000259 [Cnephaeus nilssonii]|uniref:Uncharacterized protein n=1 Tax=Cnephaeus nilssonii TaxID=3371016 RepID=A0AA40IB70_CNENI|nr:hypothetical protein QTO34_000259 [Eptesicus nilssonii]